MDLHDIRTLQGVHSYPSLTITLEDCVAKITKHVGDVLGISRARVPAGTPRATKDRGGNPKGIEVGTRRRHLERAGVVGGVRGRGR